MSNKRGFTLIEIIIVMIILGILTAVALPNYFTMLQQGAASAAQNNLISIYNAQLNYYNTNNAYCLTTSAAPCDNLTDISTNLLNMTPPLTDNNFTYQCVVGGATANGFQCTATSVAGGSGLTLTLTKNSIVLPGGATCANNTVANPGCNPSCNNASICPTN